jgi:mannose-6-phosphate isomerase-like protein (cupin superfamily)
MNIIQKPWGQEEILETNENYTVKRLLMRSGHKCSLQLHRFKQETIYVLSGVLSLHAANIIGNQNFILGKVYLKEGDSITIESMRVHRMEAENGDVVYLECSTSQLDDIVRIEDDYNRK